MKLLLIEDEYAVQSVVNKLLLDAGFLVEQAYDGLEGFEKAKKNKYDCVLLDIKLPSMNGFQILSALRQLGIKTPILILSSMHTIDDKIKALDMVADDYIHKQADTRELIARIKAVARRRYNHKRNILRAGNITIDISTFTTSIGHKHIDLTRTELHILMTLMRHMNTVVSRDELINEAWGERKSLVHSNTLDVHMKTLRHKVFADEACGVKISTLRGFGYMLESIS